MDTQTGAISLAWQSVVAAWLQNRYDVSTEEIGVAVLDRKELFRSEEIALGRLLRSLGYERTRVMKDGIRSYRYRKHNPESAPTSLFELAQVG